MDKRWQEEHICVQYDQRAVCSVHRDNLVLNSSIAREKGIGVDQLEADSDAQLRRRQRRDPAKAVTSYNIVVRSGELSVGS